MRTGEKIYLKPTYEGLKAPDDIPGDVVFLYLKPTYEGLKVCPCVIVDMDIDKYLKPTYEGLKAFKPIFIDFPFHI